MQKLNAPPLPSSARRDEFAAGADASMDSTDRAITRSGVTMVVTRGPDEGTRLDLEDEAPRLIGRARDAHLILSDLAVSRRHLEVQAAGAGVHVRGRPEAAPFVVDRQAVREAFVPVGSAIRVGGSVLCVVERTFFSPMRITCTGAHTLLEGAAVEVAGLAAISTLVTWLDGATDLAAVRSVLERWASLHADADNADLHLEDACENVNACGLHRQGADDVITRETGDQVEVTVPAHAQSRAWLIFRFAHPSHRLVEPSRLRLLLVAGRVFGSSLARIHSVSVAEAQLTDVRRAAVGRARAFLGSSPAALKVAQMVDRLAAIDTTVLLQGETGVGKSFVARLLHENGPRAREPLRVVNCACLPESLLESELFGHEKGAFTGAVTSREGAFEFAGRGTLFLDELGELSLASQVKLLGALELRQFERLGSNRPIQLRARIVCATNQDLAAKVAEGTFRADLLYRISVISVRVPPLRERGDDLLLLAEAILQDLAPTTGRRVDGFAEDALQAICRYAWPGNVRELRNAIEHALVLGTERRIRAHDFPAPLGALSSDVPLLCVEEEGGLTVKLPAPIEALERLDIEAALKVAGGNRTKAAALLGVSRATLYNKLRTPST